MDFEAAIGYFNAAIKKTYKNRGEAVVQVTLSHALPSTLSYSMARIRFPLGNNGFFFGGQRNLNAVAMALSELHEIDVPPSWADVADTRLPMFDKYTVGTAERHLFF